MDVYHQRAARTAPYLRGHGVEIGAGPNPQGVPEGVSVTHSDLRSREELSAYFGQDVDLPVIPASELPNIFPSRADFLIAHHVLEHLPDTIGGLRQWHAMVVEGGIFVLSVPHYLHSPDRDRLTPSLEHVVLDHLLVRDGDAFESREHVMSFLLSWIDDSPALQGLSAPDACRTIIGQTHRGGHDFHWHAFNPELFRDVIVAAAALDGFAPDFLIQPEDHNGTIDILATYRLRPMTVADASVPVLAELERVCSKLARAVAILSAPLQRAEAKLAAVAEAR